MKKLIAVNKDGEKITLCQEGDTYLMIGGLQYIRDGNELSCCNAFDVPHLTILYEEVETDSATVTTTTAPWTTDGGTVTIPWDVNMTPVYAAGMPYTVVMYAAGPVRDKPYSPARWKFPHPEDREPVTRENLYDWIIQSAVDGKIKRCDHEEHYTKIQCPACQGVGWVLK